MQDFELSESEISTIQKIIEKNNQDAENLIKILQDIQSELGYVSKQAQKMVAEKLQVSVSKVYGVVSFYNFFQMNPPGEHRINVCLGTACYVRGANKILNELDGKYGIKEGQTTKDRKYSLDVVRCVGCCALGPVMTVDGNVCGKVTPQKIKNVLKKCE